MFIFFCYFCLNFPVFLFCSFSFLFILFSFCSFSLIFLKVFFFFYLFIFFILFRFLKWNQMKTTWPGADIVPKINYDGRELAYACAAAYVRLNNEKTHVFHLYYMKGHEGSITFHQKRWHQACLVFMLLAFKKATAKIYFLHYDIWVKTLYTTLYVL